MKSKAPSDAPAGSYLSTRREVLKGLAAGSFAAAGSLVSGAAAAAEKGKASAWADEADVLVVGTGVGGIAAALAAAKQGSSVIVLEKMPFTGGTTAKSGGVFWIPNNAWLKSQGIADERDDILRYMVRLAQPTRYDANSPTLGIEQSEFDLMTVFVDNAPKVLETLVQTTGLKYIPWWTWENKPFPDYYAEIPENKVHRGRSLVADLTGEPDKIIWPQNGGGGAALLYLMQKGIDKLPVKVLLEHAVLDVLKNDAGEVCGLVVDRGDAEPARFRAKKAVLFATGGFTHNLDLAHAHLKARIWGGCAAAGSTGDFVGIGERLGARMGNMQNAWWGQIQVEMALKTRSVPVDVWSTPGDSMIQVNRYGKRFANEKIQYNERTQTHFYWDPVKAEYPNLVTFMIWDSRTAKNFAGYDPIPAENAKQPHVMEAPSLEALAEKIKVHLQGIAPHTGGLELDATFTKNLKTTIKRYNEFARKGKDEDFSRGEHEIERAFHFMGAKPLKHGHPNLLMHPIADAGPYYCVILGAGTLDTKGGPVVNSKLQVLDQKSQPIRGLYAVGNCTAHPSGQAYWSGGSTIGSAMTFGYVAGSHCHGEGVKQA